MAGITALGTTFNLPNYVGELFAVGRQDTPFLSAIGGLTGGKSTLSPLFEWQRYDLRDPAANRNRVEGADAPAPVGRVRANVSNVVEIHHESIAVSYTKLAATAQRSSTGAPAGDTPVVNESAWQIEQELKQVARDINFAFLNGTYANPADNQTPRATRGLLQAITTNVTDVTGALGGGDDLADTSADLLFNLMQDIYDAGGIREGETRTLLTNSTQKRKLSEFFAAKGLLPTTREIAGVNVTVVETDFGILNVMLEPAVPQDTIVVASVEECSPVFLEVPDKGFLFVEPLAKTGATDRSQLYGEVGLEYGIESHHGKLVGLAVA